MNRRQRRAFARTIARAVGRAKAPTPQGPSVEERLAQLERENTELRATVAGLESAHDRLPGVREERRDWFVLVGGKRVELKALPPIEWVQSLEELPSFLFAFVTERVSQPGAAPSPEVIGQIVKLARRWVRASAVDPEALDLDRLTLPEAEHAVAHIATLNGVTDSLRAWFRGRLQGVAGPAPDGQGVRATPERPAGGQPN